MRITEEKVTPAVIIFLYFFSLNLYSLIYYILVYIVIFLFFSMVTKGFQLCLKYNFIFLRTNLFVENYKKNFLFIFLWI